MSATINERKIVSYVSQEELMKKLNTPAAAVKTVTGAVEKETTVRHEHREHLQEEQQTIDVLSKVIGIGIIMIVFFSLPVLFLPFLAISGFFMIL